MSARIPRTAVGLWHDRNDEDLPMFCARNFPGSAVGNVRRAPGDYPNGKQGDALRGNFTMKIDVAAIAVAVCADA